MAKEREQDHDFQSIVSEDSLPMETLNGGGDLISKLRCQLKSLQIKVEELEKENASMSSQLSSCSCRKLVENPGCLIVSSNRIDEENKESNLGDGKMGMVSRGGDEVFKSTELQKGIKRTDKIKKKKTRDKSSGCIMETMHHHAKRYVALKVMYFGQRFYGFASEAQMDPTVESEIFKALKTTRLLVGDKVDSQYSRCGRTDKGVSSVGQVVALLLRSKLKSLGVHANYEEISSKKVHEEEIDYVGVLNKVLPKDIRIMGWCPAPTEFHARFSCLSREYKYLFWGENLDILAMETASKKFVGEHDYRNFCKMDAVNVHNYRRHITSFEISSCDERSDGHQLWAITIKGSAFLWHQVRCMVAVLFMIGQGLESPTVIDDLLDIEKIPRKPQYVMAPELPLILQTCEFQGLSFICSPDAAQVLREHLTNELKAYKLQASIFLEALVSCSFTENERSPLYQSNKKKTSHILLMSRPTEPSYEERRVKLKARSQEAKQNS